ncbi:MAG: outer membrane lipoprotein carrier protein LolA [Thermoanaerobaculia bacterium]
MKEFRCSHLAARLFFSLALALAITTGAARGGEEKVPDPDAPGLTLAQRSEALLDRIRYEQKHLRTLEAEFVQFRVSEFLAAPEESRGAFAYSAPDLVRWDYLTPKPVSLVIREDEMLTWYKDLGTAEKVKVGRASAQVFRYLNASGSLDTLMKYFAVTFSFPPAGTAGAAEPYRLDLSPRFARIRKRLAAMSLWIDRKLFLPVRVRYVEVNGDTTEYRFDHLRSNGEIPLTRFELAIPKEVEIRVVDLDRGRDAKP